jgi:hypothetical protein
VWTSRGGDSTIIILQEKQNQSGKLLISHLHPTNNYPTMHLLSEEHANGKSNPIATSADIATLKQHAEGLVEQNKDWRFIGKDWIYNDIESDPQWTHTITNHTSVIGFTIRDVEHIVTENEK